MAVGQDDALDGGVGDVALVPEGDVLHGGDGVAAEDAGEAAEAFAGDGVALVGHGAGALLALGEALLDLADLGALEVAEFGCPALDAAAGDGERGEELGVAVALEDLRGERRGPEAEGAADMRLDARVEMGVGADGAGDLADGGLMGAQRERSRRFDRIAA